MFIDSIALENFRNYARTELKCSPGINVVTGGNAQGKTNLLEAIHCLSGSRPFRAGRDRELIRFGCEYAYLNAVVSSGSNMSDIEIRLNTKGRKQILINSVKKKNAADLSSKLRTVLFCPVDLELIYGSPALRRHFMDNAISQLRPRYAAALREHSRLYEHKKRILHSYREKPSLLDVLDDFNDRLSEMSTLLIYYRAAWCEKLAAAAGAAHNEMSGGLENMRVLYKTVGGLQVTPELKPSAIREALKEHQKSHRQAEIDAASCLSGSHKDDILIEINGVQAKNFASQGQARTCTVSLKLAERAISFEDTGEFPVLLLDDVLSELDSERQSFVLNKITGGQVFISCCEGGSIKNKTGGLVITVENGMIL